MKWFTLKFDFGAGDTTKIVSFPDSCPRGLAKLTKVKNPNYSSAPTFTLDVYDSVQDKIYSKASLANNAITLVTDVFPIVPGGKAILTATAAVGSADSSYVTFFIFNED